MAFLRQYSSQVMLCEPLAMWPKLTAAWLVSLSAVTGSSTIDHCEVSQPADNWARNCNHWWRTKRWIPPPSKLMHQQTLEDSSPKEKMLKPLSKWKLWPELLKSKPQLLKALSKWKLRPELLKPKRELLKPKPELLKPLNKSKPRPKFYHSQMAKRKK